MHVHSRNRLFACAILAVAVAGTGCGGRRGGRGLPGEIPMAGYDHYFFVGIPEPEEMTELERQQRIDNEIDRLASPAWKTARKNLFRLGKPAIDRLIQNLDRTEPSGASVRPVPGPTLPEREPTWPLGYVVYTVLSDFVGSYTNYVGTDLPAFDKRDWTSWWGANRKGMLVYDARTTAPGYVQDQLARAEVALSSRYKTIAQTVARQKASEAKMKGEWERRGARQIRPEKGDERPARKQRRSVQPRKAKAEEVKEEPAEEVTKKVEEETEKPTEEAEEPTEEPEEEPKEPPEKKKRSGRRGRRRR